MVSPVPNEHDKGLDPYVRRQSAKLTQVIQNFFTKTVHIVTQARNEDASEGSGVGSGSLGEARGARSAATYSDLGGSPRGESPGTNIVVAAAHKINKWFNLHIFTTDAMKDDLKLWRSNKDLSLISPLIIETFLDLRQLTPRQVAMLGDDNVNYWTVAKGGSKKHEVVLERWLIEFDPNEVSGSTVDELPLIYKQAIVLIRSIYSYSRLMPAYRLRKSLKNSLKNSRPARLSLGTKVLDGKQPISSKGRIGLSKPIIPHQLLLTESHLDQMYFTPIQTTMGTLKVSIAYRRHADFTVHDSEEILSTHFISMDGERERELARDSEHPRGGAGEAGEASDPDRDPDRGPHDDHSRDKRLSLSSRSMSVSPCTSNKDERRLVPVSSVATTATPPADSAVSPPPAVVAGSGPVVVTDPPRPLPHPHQSHTSPVPSSGHRPIQPFKIGSIGSSPPPGPNTPTNIYGGSLERRISITSNKSASNASLAALLRNPRSSNSSSNTTSNIPIAGASTSVSGSSHNAPVVPRSISSSHGSNLPHDDGFFPQGGDASVSGTPRFSSSFGSRASRRFSSTSMKQGTPNINDASYLATSSGSASSAAALSGLYIDDDISDFVKMIDSKSDLRFSSFDTKSSYHQSSSQLDALNRFQSLKGHHQQLGDSVNASLILHHNQGGSRASSRKSSQSVPSPESSLPYGSYDSHLPSIHSRLRESSTSRRDSSGAGGGVASGVASGIASGRSYSGGPSGGRSYSGSGRDSGPEGSRANDASAGGIDSRIVASGRPAVVGPSTSRGPGARSASLESTKRPFIYGTGSALKSHPSKELIRATATARGYMASDTALDRKDDTPQPTIRYENVFDDDEEEGDDYFLRATKERQGKKLSSDNDDDDDLLFTMSDMHISKH